MDTIQIMLYASQVSRWLRSAGRLGMVCVAIGGVPVSSQAPPHPLRGIFGIYGQTSPGRDSIHVTERPGGKIGVAVKLYYSNGHTCRLNKDGDWREDHVAVVAEGLDADQPCRLSVFFDKGRVTLKDEGFRCAAVYCGTRGRLDNVTLPKVGANRE